MSDGFQRYGEARICFDKCYDLNPTSILVNLNKSQNLILLESFGEGEDLLNKILKKIEGIEDRSTKIITIILLICSNYLHKGKVESSNAKLIEELLRLLSLKDSKLVDWNFKNLEKIIDKRQYIDEDEDDDGL